MPRFKEIKASQGMLLPIVFGEQLIPGTFEHALCQVVVEGHVDLTVFHDRYHNDHAGARAYPPEILLKIVLYAYSRGIRSSRKMAQLCRDNIVFKALSGNTEPDFTTIADFISAID